MNSSTHVTLRGRRLRIGDHWLLLFVLFILLRQLHVVQWGGGTLQLVEIHVGHVLHFRDGRLKLGQIRLEGGGFHLRGHVVEARGTGGGGGGRGRGFGDAAAATGGAHLEEKEMDVSVEMKLIFLDFLLLEGFLENI